MIARQERLDQQTVVVIGNGMVGHRFCENLIERDALKKYRIVTFCEEPRPAYNRVNLTKFFSYRDPEPLMLARQEWYQDHGITLYVGDKATAIDRDRRVVRSARGREISYDRVVLATGSAPFVPAIPGVDKKGVFVYRTIEDLERIIAYARHAKRAAVIGGGLLGLEAAKAVYDLSLETHVIEFAPRLMPRQVDEAGSRLLVRRIEDLGVRVHLSKNTSAILGNGKVDGMEFADCGRIDLDMVVISAGINPRDELARACGLTVGPRGGVVVDDHLESSDPDIFAIGEIALHRNMIYGLVAPGYAMADVLAANLTGQQQTFSGADLSTKLKLMGVDVASFGNCQEDPAVNRALTFEDPFRQVYKRLLFNLDGSRLLGGILVGEASEYGTLLAYSKSPDPLPVAPAELLLGKRERQGAGAITLSPAADCAQVCSCNNVSQLHVRQVIRDRGLTTLAEVKQCTRAGTGCGGCLPLVTELLKVELSALGKKVVNHLCEHFPYSRQELFQIVKIKGLKSFTELISSHGQGHGCEICKPAVASILASLWNENVMDHTTLQDTNDRFLANIQRGGLYSVVPRIPGGEITPEKLIVLGQVAQKFGLYTKITGGQRVDLFGAPVHRLPEIWEELVNAGFESGHAYGKALRTVKSCVGTTWCRYGVQDAVSFAVRVELRYRGVRAAHKIKAAVSGCVRECAEAQGKDFGLIATEKGWNLYVCGNGGANPRHATLLAVDLDEETALKYIDRFIMYYIQTADRLTRTSVWLEKLQGGIEFLRDVIINDRLGICEELERQMQFLVDSYQCEWKAVVDDPEKRRLFQQFVNTDQTESSVEFVTERGQRRPADWPSDFVALEQLSPRRGAGHETERPGAGPTTEWAPAGKVWDFPIDGGSTIQHGRSQVAVFHFRSRGQWYACQNMCPHKKEMVLSRGIIGDQGGIPKVACPLHKKTFSLDSGTCLSGEDYQVQVFPVKVERDDVYVKLPPAEELDELLRAGTSCAHSCV